MPPQNGPARLWMAPLNAIHFNNWGGGVTESSRRMWGQCGRTSREDGVYVSGHASSTEPPLHI